MTLLELMPKTHISEALGWALLHSLWQGAVVAATFGLTLIATRSPRVRYIAGCAALLTMLAGFAATLFYLLPESTALGQTPAEITMQQPVEKANAVFGDNAFPDFRTLIPRLASFWLIGVSLFQLRCFVGWLSSNRMQRRGVCQTPDSWQRLVSRLGAELRISQPVALLESLFTDTPVVLGHFVQ